MPEYIPTDPLFAQQWYLKNTGQTGFGPGNIDLNVTQVWPDYTGAGVTVAVCDNGVDYNHPDLNDNYDASQHVIIDGNPSDANWLPPGSVGGTTGFNPLNSHGTGMAGIAAAENDGAGSVGVAFDATLVGVYWPILSTTGSTLPPNLLQAAQQLGNFDVAVFASGALTYTAGAQSATWSPFYAALQTAASTGRDGLGAILLNSVHNNGPGFGNYDNNASQWDSTRFAIHVGGVTDEGVVVVNATRSAAMLVSGLTGYQPTAEPPGSPRNIINTDITGADGAVPGDYGSAGGTTSAVSQIAGVAALLLEANPDLGWRDVQEILSLSARHVGSAVGTPHNVGATETNDWNFNGAGDWNGGGRHYSIDYGYGLVDALAAVRLAETWHVGATAATSTNEASSFNQITPASTPIPDNNGNSVTLTFNVTDAIDIETVQLRLGFNHTRAENLQIVVTSPDGTTSPILHVIDSGAHSVTGSGWRFQSQEFRGELSVGAWTVTITDMVSGNTGTVTGNSALAFFGSSNTADDRYVYTNEFSDYADLGGRSTLTDTDGGADTINAAAVAAAATIDLNAGSTSSIDGHDLTIAAGTTIENAVSGDGDDTLTGNDTDNTLSAGRGNDTITGGAGVDTVTGGAGNDTISGGAENDTIVFSGARSDYTVTYNNGPQTFTVTDNRPGSPDGTDAITVAAGQSETFQFADQTVVICFYPGTMIRTPEGEAAVETLKRGDLVTTSDGRALPVTWVGRQTVSTRFGDPLRVLPIRIKAGALGDNVPARDLLLSPDHAVLVEGALIQAGALVNGTSIVREADAPEVFTYYHVELDDHSLILAENAPAETFVDHVDRLAFDNWAEHEALYPQGKPIVELPYPRAKAHRQVPVSIRVRLAARALAMAEPGAAAA